MKKLQILLSLAAVLLTLTGCKKDNEKSGPSGETVTLSAPLGGGEKTEINGFDMKWSAGDAVNINGENYTAKFALGYETAIFENVEAATEYKAYYPASLYKSVNVYELPSTQTYAGNTLSSVNPMYAVTTTKTLQFNNICALVKLEVKGEGNVESIVVTSTTAPLHGEFEVRQGENGKYYAEIKSGESTDGSKTLTLNCSPAVPLNKDNVTIFYVALPQGNLGNLTFKIGGYTSDPVPANLEAGKLYTKAINATHSALSGKFTINASGGKVNFSRGNLQATYNGVDYDWAFAENQYDYVGNAAGNTTIDNQQNGAKVDLFGWTAANKYNDGIKQYGINTSTYYADYSSSSGDVCCDWGATIDNQGTWRMLEQGEWAYLLNSRTDVNRFAKAMVNSVKGLLIFPDDYALPEGYTTTGGTGMSQVNGAGALYPSASILPETWTSMESDGVVFLPAAGNRWGSGVNMFDGDGGSEGDYWSSTLYSGNPTYTAYFLSFRLYSMNAGNTAQRCNGYSVRLVCSAKEN